MTAWSIAGLEARQGGFALGPIDLTLDGGEVVAVIGRSGAGKTTMLRALAGFVPASAGSVRCAGRPMEGEPPERRRAVYVPAGLGLFPHRTVRRNVAYPLEIRGADADRAEVDRLLERFDLRSLADRRPGTLSSGEQQRVALARSYAADPALLLWDEPLAALDLVAREALVNGLRAARSADGPPVLLVTHDPALAASVADRWLLLDSGRPAFLGSPAALVPAPPDPFAARFVGYANVVEPGAIPRTGPLAETLRGRAGPAGVAFPPLAARPAMTGDGPIAIVERVTWGPEGARATATIDGLTVQLRVVGDRGADVHAGDRLAVTVEGASFVPLGGPGAAPYSRTPSVVSA